LSRIEVSKILSWPYRF